MRPIKNNTVGYYMPGDNFESQKIISLEACQYSEICKRGYLNFDVCGGKRRVLEKTGKKCVWYAVSKDCKAYLSDVLGGKPCGL